MLHELVFINNTASLKKISVLDEICKNNKIDRLSIPTGFLEYVSYNNLSALIDFPMGVSSTDVRKFEIQYASKFNIKSAELVINPSYMIDKMSEKIYNDYIECKTECIEQKIECIPIIEYRFCDNHFALEISKIFESCGANSVILGTGTVNSNVIDLDIIAKKIRSNTKLNVKIGFLGIEKSVKKHFESIGISAIREYSSLKYTKTNES